MLPTSFAFFHIERRGTPLFIRVGRLVRHKGSTLMLMGQDLNCVPDELFGLAELVFVFMLRNPKIWEHIRERVGWQAEAGRATGESGVYSA